MLFIPIMIYFKSEEQKMSLYLALFWQLFDRVNTTQCTRTCKIHCQIVRYTTKSTLCGVHVMLTTQWCKIHS